MPAWNTTFDLLLYAYCKFTLSDKIQGKYLTIPAVIVFWSVIGHPRATTQSPGRSLPELPSFADGSGVLDLIFTIAISECKSAFTTVPINARPSCKVTSTCQVIHLSNHNFYVSRKCIYIIPRILRHVSILHLVRRHTEEPVIAKSLRLYSTGHEST